MRLKKDIVSHIPRNHSEHISRTAGAKHANKPGQDKAMVYHKFPDTRRARAIELDSRQVAWVSGQDIIPIARRGKSYDDTGLHADIECQRHKGCDGCGLGIDKLRDE